MQLEYCGQSGIVILPDRIDLTSADKFKAALQLLYDQGYNSIIIDCARLIIIDSAGLGNLIIFQKKLKERGGELRMINVNHDYIKHLFEMIELNRVIRVDKIE